MVRSAPTEERTISRFHIEIREPELAERGWTGLTPDEERQFLGDLLNAIRDANEAGDPKPVEDTIETWWRHGILAEAGTPEEGLARARRWYETRGARTVEEIEEALERAVQAQSSTTTR